MRKLIAVAYAFVLLAVMGLPVYATAETGENEGTILGENCSTLPTEIGDTIYGTPCADVITVTQADVVEIRGGGGADTITAAGDVDFISAGAGDDLIIATTEVSEVYGGDGNDEIYGDVGPTPPPPATTSGKRRLRSLASVSSSGPYPCDDPETFPPNDLC